jgi:tetratricopeptide (TPR) repeat protein
VGEPGTGRIGRLLVEGRLADFGKTADPGILRDPSLLVSAARLAKASGDASPQDVPGLAASGRYFLARYLHLHPADDKDLKVAVGIFVKVARHDPSLVPEEIIRLTAPVKDAARGPQPATSAGESAATAARAADARGTKALRHAEAAGDMLAAQLAIQELSEAVRLAAGGDPYAQAAYLNNLASAWSVKFKLTRDLDDLDDGITAARQSLAVLPPGNPSRPAILTTLGGMLLGRSERGGDPRDLDSCVQVLREARATMDPVSYCAPLALTNLGMALVDLFKRDRRRPDLDEAVAALREALKLLSADAPERPSAEANLARGLLERSHHQFSNPVQDLDEAISLMQGTFSRLNPADSTRPLVADNLSNGLRRRYRLAANQADAVNAAQVLQEAMAVLAPHDNWHGVLAAELSDAAALLSEGPESTGPGVPQASRRTEAPVSSPEWADDVDPAALRAQVREAIPDRPPGLDKLVPWAYANADAGRAEDSIRELRNAAFSSGASTDWQLEAAIAWARIASGTDAAQALTAYRTALARVAGLAGGHLDTRSRLMTFIEFNGFASEAAALAVELGDLEEAVTLLENNRNLWRTFAGSAGATDRSTVPDPSDWRAAAADGPVVILNPSARRSDALVVTRDGTTAIRLDLSLTELRHQVSTFIAHAKEARFDQFDAVLTETLSWMTEAVTAPVLDQLRGYGSTRRLWWCPASLLSVLPWHATALDHFVSSYTPSLGSLLTARRPRRPSALTADPPRLLAIGVSHAPGMEELPNAAAEAREVAGYFSRSPTVLLDEQATRGRVLEEMPRASWVHFSCHASQSFLDPLDGSIALYDGQITVADLMPLSVPGGDLAFLSACETSQPSVGATDETITVAAVVHEAGYRSVIATGWVTGDAIARQVANSVYRDITGGNPDAGKAAQALHKETCRLRESWPQEPSVWAAYLHIGV